jgi:hypothetical protein
MYKAPDGVVFLVVIGSSLTMWALLWGLWEIL